MNKPLHLSSTSQGDDGKWCFHVNTSASGPLCGAIFTSAARFENQEDAMAAGRKAAFGVKGVPLVLTHDPDGVFGPKFCAY